MRPVLTSPDYTPHWMHETAIAFHRIGESHAGAQESAFSADPPRGRAPGRISKRRDPGGGQAGTLAIRHHVKFAATGDRRGMSPPGSMLPIAGIE